MKKIWLFWWIFWLLYSFEAAAPGLVEARSWTNRSKSTSSSTYCDGAGKCATSTNVTEHKDNQPRYNPYGYGGYYAPSGPSWGPVFVIPIMLEPICVFSCGSRSYDVAPAPAVTVPYCSDAELKIGRAQYGTSGFLHGPYGSCYYDLR